ncbi:MAG: type II toxin-antitoxin system RelE/ParE family toxin, partial [Elusimicrobia bacterium]|nr:type II toxin-antitoxin system RelE/ParE family toxin [Elusimicrobiota bacterium]
MEALPVRVLEFLSAGGRCPFRDWLSSLGAAERQRVDARLVRLRRGLWGDAKALGGGLWELRIDAGPGERVYFGRLGPAVIVLLG